MTSAELRQSVALAVGEPVAQVFLLAGGCVAAFIDPGPLPGLRAPISYFPDRPGFPDQS